MKKLKLDHQLAQMVLSGQKTSTWRLFDDKDLRVNDNVLLVDKVDPKDPNSWSAIGTATINQVVERRLDDLTQDEMLEHGYDSKDHMFAAFRKYYGPNVNGDTPVKIVHFRFIPDLPPEKQPELLSRTDKIIIYADGGSRGNPGPSACGFVLYDDHHNMLVNRGVYLGITTNNQAEYTALKMALEETKSLGAHSVHVYMDSMLVVNQMRGIYKVKNRDLWPIHDAIKQLCNSFNSVDFTQVPRESNKIADAAVNAALDSHLHSQPAAN